jgi:hypothetical protein
MALAVSRQPLAVEARIRAHVCPRGICGGQSGTGRDFFLRVLRFYPVNIILPRLSRLIYRLGDEQ